MIDDSLLQQTLSPLPLALRSSIYANVKRKLEETKSREISQDIQEKEVVLLILQELYSSLIQPLELAKSILHSKQLAGSKSFKIEFSEAVFDSAFIEGTSEFVGNYWALVTDLGFGESIRRRYKASEKGE